MDLREHVRLWTNKIHEQREAFAIYHLVIHELDPEDFLMCQWGDGMNWKIGLERKRPEHREVYVRSLESKIQALESELKELKYKLGID